MFGKNTITGAKYFEDAGDRVLVTSMFMTLQGEGPLRGEPAFFIRFSKCQLQCSFCDTYFDSGDWLTISELEKRIEKTIEDFYEGSVPRWAKSETSIDDVGSIWITKRKMALVITGGEPTLQKNLVPVLEHFSSQFEKTQIESNGITFQPVPESTIYVVSPKCLEKNGKPTKYLKPHPKVMERADCLKFVMSAEDSSPYSTIPDWAFEWREETGREIFVSPMNIYNEEPSASKDARSKKNDITLEERSVVDEVISFWTPGLLNLEENQKNHEYVARYCVKNCLTLNLQMHLYTSLA